VFIHRTLVEADELPSKPTNLLMVIICRLTNLRFLFLIVAFFTASACYAQCPTIPLVYCGVTDTVAHNGSVPALGAAGTITTDPDYGSKVLRVTSGGACGEKSTYSFNTSPSGWQPIWNNDSSKVIFIADDGYEYYQGINTSATPISLSGGCVNITNQVQYAGFSFLTTNLIYGLSRANSAVLASWDTVVGHAAMNIYDFSTMPGLSLASYVGVQFDRSDAWFCVNGAQDASKQVGCYNRVTSSTQVLDLAAATTKQGSAAAEALDNLNTAQLANCTVHATGVSPAGDWLMINLGNSCTAFPGGPGSIMFLQFGTNHVVYLPSHYNQHSAIGWNNIFANGDHQTTPQPCSVYVNTAFDLWDITSPGTLGSEHYVQAPGCLSTLPIYDSHMSWFNNKNDANANRYPFVTQFNYGGPVLTGAAYEWELLMVDPGPALSALNAVTYRTAPPSTVWRIAHTFNDSQANQCSSMGYVSANISRDGKYVAFSSDWFGQTGIGGCTNNRRTDVFIVDATTAGSNSAKLPPPTGLSVIVQ
jgi:hypothetical protein